MFAHHEIHWSKTPFTKSQKRRSSSQDKNKYQFQHFWFIFIFSIQYKYSFFCLMVWKVESQFEYLGDHQKNRRKSTVIFFERFAIQRTPAYQSVIVFKQTLMDIHVLNRAQGPSVRVFCFIFNSSMLISLYISISKISVGKALNVEC